MTTIQMGCFFLGSASSPGAGPEPDATGGSAAGFDDAASLGADSDMVQLWSTVMSPVFDVRL